MGLGEFWESRSVKSRTCWTSGSALLIAHQKSCADTARTHKPPRLRRQVVYARRVNVQVQPSVSRCPLHEDHVRAVLALHPGEHFLPVLDLTHSLRFGRRSRDQAAMVVQLTE